MGHSRFSASILRAGVVALLTLIAACASAASMTQTSASFLCADDFDFWLGDWTVRQRILRADGTWLELPAATSASREGGSCAIVEHWSGQVQFFWEGMTVPEEIWGLSVRTIDPQTRRWSIYWMDSRTPRFDAPYVGAFQNGRGEFFRTIETRGGPRIGRISFSRVHPDIVDWELAVAPVAEGPWTVLWTMEMTRRARTEF